VPRERPALGASLTRELPFLEAEYRDRARRVREEMGRRGVDVLFVMSPANLCYLTGFESIWYPPRAPLGVVVSRHDERLVFLDYERHETLVRQTALLDDAVFYRYENALDMIAAAFLERGWHEGTVGIEWWTQTPGGPLVRETADRLDALAARRRSSTSRSPTCSTRSGRGRRSSRSPPASMR
jgi:Xaa-Pro aminopeptidase